MYICREDKHQTYWRCEKAGEGVKQRKRNPVMPSAEFCQPTNTNLRDLNMGQALNWTFHSRSKKQNNVPSGCSRTGMGGLGENI